ncbi:pseudouridine synthase [Chytriomyces cf. hyalinus JEL632]|nr:pseudouridine synthase [Chytriomyces cf. hyalinus JEL632]
MNRIVRTFATRPKPAARPAPIPTPSTIIRKVSVEDELHNSTVEDFVAKTFSLRKSFARLKVLNKEVSVSGSAHANHISRGTLKPNSLLNAGDVVEVILPAGKKALDPGVKKQMKKDLTSDILNGILYKDQHIIVVNKPGGLAVQGGSKVQFNLADVFDGLKFNNPDPPKLVHRLDKDTTGCLILARTKESAARVSELFSREDNSSSGRISKRYQALLLGTPAEKSGTITTGIVQYGEPPAEKLTVIEWHESDEGSDNEMAIKKAVTSYRVLHSQKHVSLVEFTPMTGRKHQLRLHSAEVLKAAVVGDYKYGEGVPKHLRSAFGSIKTVPIHLHLREICIKDWYGPGKDFRVEAPLPSHMTRTLKAFNLKSD